MTRRPSSALGATIKALERALRKVGRPHMIVGGVAVVARGVARMTRDVDATVWASGLSLEELMAALREQEIVGRVRGFLKLARENQVLFLEHTPTKTSLEILLGWLPFELEAMQRAEMLQLGSARAPVVLAEDLIVYKAAAWQARDRDDAERLLALHGRHIDLKRVRSLVAQFAEALEQPERVPEFEAVVRRALG